MKFNYGNMLEETIGKHGLPLNSLLESRTSLNQIKKRIQKKINKDYYPLQLPEVMASHLNKIKNTAKKIQENYENFVIVGIGGSSLGNELLHYTINGIYSNDSISRKTPRIYFMNNIDPESTQTLLTTLDLKKTMFNVITKSGSTSETMQNLLSITDALKKKNLGLKKHLIFTTDPEKGLLRKLSHEFSIETFAIHPLVGGRYSVFSAVGLLSAAVEGINIDALLRGAELIKKNITKESNPTHCAALLLPLIQYKLYKERGVNINTLFIYSDGLSHLGTWYRQLLSESIGKRFTRSEEQIFTGITPIGVRGATDQHSMLQLLMEGPFDKFIIFIAPAKYRKDSSLKGNLINNKDINYLKNKKASQLIKSEFLATQAAIKTSGKPSVTIEIPEINEEELGKLIYFAEYEVIALGEMLNVDPVNQPAVEFGKQLTYGIMKRKGFEEKNEKIMEFKKVHKKHIIKIE